MGAGREWVRGWRVVRRASIVVGGVEGWGGGSGWRELYSRCWM